MARLDLVAGKGSEKNRHFVVSKRGQKYETYRSAWITYANFDQMCDQVIEELQNANLTELLNTPKWMDKDGNEVKEDGAFSCKVTHNILRPDMCLGMDELGGNNNQKGDGNVGGQL